MWCKICRGGETLPLFQQQQQNWGSGLPRGVLAAAPGRRADVLLCLQGVPGLVTQGPFLLMARPTSRTGGSLLQSSCWVVAASTEMGECTLTQPAAAEQAVLCLLWFSARSTELF